ncbi:MAG: DUF2993 domain-containing protein [Firmicutes bacterium]|nr:DUF2993 domain-containing protein [Bacillota bacterium]
MRRAPAAGPRRASRKAALVVTARVVAAGVVGGGAWSRTLPHRASEQVRVALAAMVQDPAALEVTLASRPGLALLAGRIDRLEVSGRELQAGQLRAERFRLYGEGVTVDLAASAREGRLVVSSARRLELELVLSEQALNEYLQRNGQLARLLRVRLTPQGPRLVLEASVDDETVSLGLDGRLMVEPGNVVALVPDRLSIERDGTPALSLDVAGAPGVLRVPLGTLPVPVVIERLQTGEGQLLVWGRHRPAAP